MFLAFSRDLAIPRDQRVMCLYQWEPFFVSRRPTKFGDNMHCGMGDIIFLVVEEQDSAWSLKSAITINIYSRCYESTWNVMPIRPILLIRLLSN